MESFLFGFSFPFFFYISPTETAFSQSYASWYPIIILLRVIIARYSTDTTSRQLSSLNDSFSPSHSPVWWARQTLRGKSSIQFFSSVMLNSQAEEKRTKGWLRTRCNDYAKSSAFISSFRTHFHGCNQLIRSLKDTVFHCVHRRQWCGWIMTQSLPQILTHAQFLCYFILCYFSLSISDYKAPNQPFIIGNYSGGLLLL